MQYLASKAKRTPAQKERLRQYLDVHYPTGISSRVAGAQAKLKTANEVTPDQKTTRLQAQLTSLETSLAGLKVRAANGESVAKPLKWQEDRIAAIRRELRAK